jgi:hypothetical protein
MNDPDFGAQGLADRQRGAPRRARRSCTLTPTQLGAWQLGQGAPPASWTNQIAATIKQYAPKQLVFDGSDGTHTQNGAAIPSFSVSQVDVVSDHLCACSSTASSIRELSAGGRPTRHKHHRS